MSDAAAALAAVCAVAGDSSAYETDWTRRRTGRALAVALPTSTDDVVAVLGVCRARGWAVTVQGGNTGLVQGAVPDDTVVLSTRRLTRLDPVQEGTVVAGAGVTLEGLQRTAAAAGWEYGVDMASRSGATVGGMLATNAGGLHVVAYGGTRAQVLGVEAVLADGSVVSRLEAPRKESTGYDLGQLLVGSEGTLGVITAARLRLVPAPPPLATLLVPASSVAAAVALLDDVQRTTWVHAAELLLDAGARLVETVAGLSRLPAAPAYLLLEVERDRIESVAPQDASVGIDEADRDRLWSYRDRLTEAIQTLGIPHKLDVSLPRSALAPFLDALPQVTQPWTTHVFGHLAEGNLHVNVVGPADEDDGVDEAVLRLVASYGGSIAAEHGVGRAKRDWLHLSRSGEEISAMRALKHALDPAGLLGPGVLLPESTRAVAD